MCELDEDTLIEILSRLPAKSLVRFMSVSRLWKSIVTSPLFRLVSNRPTKLLVHTDRECYTVVEGYEEDEKKAAELVFEADFPLWHTAYIIGSDNGLICIEIYSFSPNGRMYPKFIIWNPSIRKHVLFPDTLEDDVVFAHSFGFGATNSGLDYKLVKIVIIVDLNGGTEEKAFHIYSLKAGTWRKFCLDNESYSKRSFRPFPALLRGRLHWIVKDSSCLKKCTNYISTLDLEDEVFENKAMMLPQQLSTASNNVVTVIKESLAMVAFECERNCSSFWVMQEYGDVGSWVKLFSIDHTLASLNANRIEKVGVLKNGNLLLYLCGMSCPSKLVMWDPKTRKTNNFGGGVLSPPQVCSFTNCYKESLVLLADYEDRAVPDHKV